MLRICGLNKTTLLDYPGRLAATVFLGGCNFRCPFCQNGGLVLHPEREPVISMDEVLHFLQKRSGLLEGVCVSGGEPTLSPELPAFLREIKRTTHLPVKLDTNGSQPQVIRALADEGLIDMVAMDIKSSPENYPVLCGLSHPDMEAICESVGYLINGPLDYEFRTTVVRELHTEGDFHAIGSWLVGAKACYLQAYRDSEDVLQPGFSSYSHEELIHFRDILKKTISVVEIRGID